MTASASPKRLAIFTVCSNTDLPFACVLLASARRHHPGAALFLCLADRIAGLPDRYDPAWTVVEAHTLPIPEFQSFAFRYSATDFITALKPFMFLHLLDECGFDAAMYFDTDIELFAPVTSAASALANGASFFLTPQPSAAGENAMEPDDTWIMQAGAHSPVFLAAAKSEEALLLLGWWGRRLRYDCISTQPAGRFVDQELMDLASGFARHTVIAHDPALNLAPWNLQQHQLGQSADGWTVDGAPLAFFHFSGFNPHEPSRLSRHDPYSGAPLSPALQALTAHYAEALFAAGYGSQLGLPYAYAHFASGAPIPAVVRQMFRDWHPFWAGDPFQTYQAFLDEPWPQAARSNSGQTVSNLMRFLQASPSCPAHGLHLQNPTSASAVIRWFVNGAGAEFLIDPALGQPAATRLGASRAGAARIAPTPGVEMDIAITAPLAAGNRAAECGRAIFHSLLTSKLAVEMLDSATLVPSAAPVQLLCLEVGQLATVLPAWCSQLPPDALRIVVPLWDFARFPQPALAALALAHEVWAPSRFIQGALAGQLDCPVLHMPVAVDATPASSTHHALPGGRFRFLSLVGAQPAEDCRAAMDAFRRAFPQRGRACLVLAPQEPLATRQRAELAAVADADPDILLLDQPLSPTACDALVALQRSEGVARPVMGGNAAGAPGHRHRVCRERRVRHPPNRLPGGLLPHSRAGPL